MLTREQILEDADIIDRLERAIEAADTNNDGSRRARETWKNAWRERNLADIPTDYFWSDEAQDKIRTGDRETVEDSLLFLEVDPSYHRSCCLREVLLDSLGQAPLTEDDKARIRAVLLRVAGVGRHRIEFSSWCSLAVIVTTDDFEKVLEEQAKGHDTYGRFSSLLRYIRDHRHDH